MRGEPYTGVIFAVFVVWRIAHIISWPWWLIAAPLELDILATAVLVTVLAAGRHRRSRWRT